MTIAELVVQISVRLDNFVDGMDQASKAVDGFLNHVGTTGQALGRVGVAFQTFGVLAAGGLGVVVREAAKSEEAFLKLEEAVRASQNAIDITRLKQQQAALAATTTSSRDTVTAVQALLVAMGLTQQQIEALTPRALNLAATFKKGPEEAALALGRSMTTGATAIRRMGVVLDETIEPARDFAQFLQALDRTTGDSAAVKSLLDGLQKLQNAFSDLLGTVGTSSLGTITAFVKQLSDIVARVTQLAQEFPQVTTGVVAFVAAMGAISAVGGTILLLLANLNKVTATVQAARAGFALLAADILPAFAPLALQIAAVVAAFVLLRPVIEAIVTAIAPLAAQLVAAFAPVASGAIATAWEAIKNVVQLVSNLIQILAPVIGEVAKVAVQLLQPAFVAIGVVVKFTLEQILLAVKAIGTIAGFVNDWLERLGLVKRTQDGVTDASGKQLDTQRQVVGAVDDQLRSLDQVLAKERQINAEIDKRANAAKLAAAESASSALQQPGLNEGGLEAIERRRARAIADAERQALRDRILSAQQFRAQLDQINEPDPTKDQQRKDKIIALDVQISQDRLAIANSFTQDYQKIAQDTVAAERQAADARLDTFRDENRARLDLLRQRSGDERDLARQRGDLDSTLRQGELDRLRRTEEIRLSLLRKSIDTETVLRQNSIRIQEGLNRAQEARETQGLTRRAKARQELVKQGFFTPEEAQQIDTAEQEQATRERIQREIALEGQRAAAQVAAVDRSIQLAKAESAARIAVLEAEHGARVAQINLTHQLRVNDLDAAILIAHAETVARLKEIQAVTDAEVARRQSLLRARQAAGEISPGEATAQQAAIDAIQQGSVAQQTAIAKGFDARVQASKDAAAISTQSRDAQIKLALEERDARKKALTEDLKLDLQRFESERLTIVQTSVAKIKDLEAQIPEKFRASFQSLAQIAAEGMKTLEKIFRDFVTAVPGILKPLEKTFRNLLPSSLSLPEIQTPGLEANVGALPVAAPAAFTAPPPPPVVQRTQVTVPLLLNGQTIAQAVMEFVDGALESTDLRNPVGA